MTTEERVENLERELARVKRRSRRLLAVVGLAAGVIGLVWIVAAIVSGTGGVATSIRANAFVLVDEDNEVCAELVTREQGALLTLFDAKHRRRVSLSANTGEPCKGNYGEFVSGLTVFDKDGECPRVRLDIDKQGPRLCLDGTGNAKVSLSADKDGPMLLLSAMFKPSILSMAAVRVDKDQSSLNLADGLHSNVTLKASRKRSGLSLYDLFDKESMGFNLIMEEDGPALRLFGENDRPCILLAASKDGPTLFLDGLDGESGISAGVLKTGPRLSLSDEDGTTRAQLAVDRGGPGLDLLDENGKIRAMLSVLKDGPVLGLSGENDKASAMLSVFKDGPVLGLCGENGKRVWSAP